MKLTIIIHGFMMDRKASVELYGSIIFLGQGHNIVKVFKKKVKKLEGTLEDKNEVSKNELWDKIKGVRIIMEIGMKSISDCFQGWRFRTSRKGLKFYMKFEADI